MKILMVASEATPLIKVGGLADVVGALPSALAAAGHDVRIMLPRYGAFIEHGFGDVSTGQSVTVPWLGKKIVVEIFSGVLPGTATKLFTLHAPSMFPGGAYVQEPSAEGFRAQMQRFTFFSWAAAHALQALDWQPDVVHCHDWHAAGVPVFSRVIGHPLAASVITIHNIESQGKWSARELFEWVGLAGTELPELARRDPAGDFNLLQQALLACDATTTVSPTYAHEILLPEYGFGLESTLATLPGGITGIVNGIDVGRFNPATDQSIAAPYSAETVTAGKQKNKAALEKLLHWTSGPQPILGVVSRLTEQKGIDVLIDALPAWVAGGGRLVVLGTGQPEIEQQLVTASQTYPQSVAVRIGFDALAAQQIYAGSDFFAMPSKFEPCGLGQLIAMRYGTLPIVRDTGGLHDTVVDCVDDPADGTGFVFQEFQSDALHAALDHALQIWQKPDILTAVRQRAMRLDFSWAASAAAYLRVYANIKK